MKREYPVLIYTTYKPQFPKMSFVQHDTEGSRITFEMYDDIDVPMTGIYEATGKVERPDGNSYTYGMSDENDRPVFEITGNKVTFILPPSALYIDGKCSASVSVYDTDYGRVTTPTFTFTVTKDLTADTPIDETNEYPVLTKLISDNETLKTTMQEAYEALLEFDEAGSDMALVDVRNEVANARGSKSTLKERIEEVELKTEHANKTVMDGLSEVGGKLAYKGVQVDTDTNTSEISDNETSANKTWSSDKITQEISNNASGGGTPYNPILYNKGSREKEYGFILPNITVNPNPIIQPDSSKIIDGAKFASVVYVEGILSNPLDKFYAYVSGHDGQDIYLYTAPTPEGVWTFRQSVRNVAASPFLGHLSSPSALIHNGKVYLYYHGNNTDGTQPTALMTSTDGINFTSSAVFPVIKVHSNKSSKFYGQSTSYASVIKHNGLFIAVFQGNSNLNNYQTVDATVTIACAISEDGENFRVMKKPLIANKPLARGYFCSTLTKIYDKWLLLYQDMSTGTIKASVGDSLDTDSFRDVGIIIDKNTAAWNAGKVEAPCVLFYNNKLYIYYTGWDNLVNKFGKIGLATIDLGVK